AALDQRLQRRPIHLPQIDPLTEIVDAAERSALFALGDDRFDRLGPHPFYRSHAKANHALDLPALALAAAFAHLVHRREVDIRNIDVRWQHADAAAALHLHLAA